MKRVVITAAVAIALGTASVAQARDPMKDAIKARQSAFTLIAANFAPMGAMAKGKKPFDKDEFAKRAENLEMLSQMSWEFFIPGSDKGNSESKPDVWTKPDEFKAKAEDFEKAVAELAVVSKEGDKEAIFAQFGKTAKTCKACHKAFKVD
jgi:cytochrome c556